MEKYKITVSSGFVVWGKPEKKSSKIGYNNGWKIYLIMLKFQLEKL
jgi:hypothetical protein